MPASFFAHPHQAFTAGFYRDEDFDFDVRFLLGQAVHGAADVGEVLATIAPLGEKDHEKWFDAWVALGTRVRRLADASAEAGHAVSAAGAYLRAATYFATAVNSVDGLGDDGPLLPTFRQHRTAWDRFVETTPHPAERVDIPYEDGFLPGYLLRPLGEETREPRPTLILNNGSDGPISSLWTAAGAGALARGYNVLFFDGPGQQSMLFERGVPFRHDWEAVITPIVDFLLRYPEVDDSRIALYGISQGGYWVPRALAFEHRIAAAIADPGVVDVAASWLAHMPKNMIELLEKGDREKFDRDMAFGMRLSGRLERTWRFRARPYRRMDSYFDTLTEVLKYRLGDLAGSITTPLLVTDPEDEQFWPGQSRRLADGLPGVTELVAFTAAEGANFHCQPLARALTDQRMFDWLDTMLVDPDRVRAPGGASSREAAEG
ncbi:alpha/beta hydrolase family protein [Rhodococcus sp. SJ]|uniref:alpha/beta hydrolase family protein n=1 Tax=Rhodococcus sp. SJ TaxID=3434112 RepID=UPI003D7BC85A